VSKGAIRSVPAEGVQYADNLLVGLTSIIHHEKEGAYTFDGAWGLLLFALTNR